jgi:hypothetical protein
MPSCHETCCDKRRVPQRRKRSPSSYTTHRNVRVVVVPPPLAKSPGLFCVDGWSPSQKRALLSTYSSRNRKPSPPNSPWIRRPRRRRPAAKNKAFYPGASASATRISPKQEEGCMCGATCRREQQKNAESQAPGGNILAHLDARDHAPGPKIFRKLRSILASALKSLRTRYLPGLSCGKKGGFAQWPAAVPLRITLLAFR